MGSYCLEYVTIVFQLFSTLLLAATFCATKKVNKSANSSPTPSQAAAAAPAAGPAEAKKTPATPAAPPAAAPAAEEKEKAKKEEDDDDDDDVQFKINVKKPEEPKDVFDDEANPAAGITVRKNKKGQGKATPNKSVIGKAASGTKQQNSGQKKSKKSTVQEGERPFLAPNEKQIGVSCYQFDSNIPPPPPPPAAPVGPIPSTVAPPIGSPNEVMVKKAPTPLKTEQKVDPLGSKIRPVVEVNNKSVMSGKKVLKTKTTEEAETDAKKEAKETKVEEKKEDVVKVEKTQI